MHRIALVREVSDSIVDCELTHLERTPIDPARARAQHAAYQATLVQAGCEVRVLPPLHALPDAVFVEDCAVVLDEIALITRPGAESRRGEIASSEAALASLRTLRHIEAPATLDGGDVLRVGHTLFVGRTPRTNPRGIEQLAALTAPYGYEVVPVEVTGCLHLKTAVCEVAPHTLLINRAWVEVQPFAALEQIAVDLNEPMAANALRIGDKVIYPAEFVRTAEKLRARGIALLPVPAEELGKAEGGVTCCSLVFEV